MFQRLFVMAVFFALVQSPQQYRIPNSHSNQQNSIYLPLVVNRYPPLVDIVKLGGFDYWGYPGTTCEYGYVTSNSPTAVYSVTLSIDVSTIYCPPEEDCYPPSYYETIFATPSLEATLPDQLNPFSYCTMYYRYTAIFGDVKLAHASLTPMGERVIYPLTVIDYLKEGTGTDTTLIGSVRNDSGHRLEEARVMAINKNCYAKSAELDTRVLEPGDETDFIINNFYCQSMWDTYPLNLLGISAQGVGDTEITR